MDGEIRIFESGASLLHLAPKSDRLMPCTARGEAETLQWVVAALNSIEMVNVPWWFLGLSGDDDNGLSSWLDSRLAHVDAILGACEQLVEDRFTAADLLKADVLRIPAVRARGDRPASEAYIQRFVARPAFKRPLPIDGPISRRPMKSGGVLIAAALVGVLGRFRSRRPGPFPPLEDRWS